MDLNWRLIRKGTSVIGEKWSLIEALCYVQVELSSDYGFTHWDITINGVSYGLRRDKWKAMSDAVGIYQELLERQMGWCEVLQERLTYLDGRDL